MKKLIIAFPAVLMLLAFSCGSPSRNVGGITFKTISMQKKEKNSASLLIWKGSAEMMKATKNADEEEEAVQLNKMIAGMLSEGETDIKSALESKKSEYIQAFKASSNEPADNGNPSIKWEGRITGKVASVTSQFICYEITDYSFSGEEPGNTVLSYTVFDRQTGQEAPLSFFFAEDKLPELQNLIRVTFVQDKEMSSYDELRKEYLTSDMEMTNNFYADDLGIHFIYNPGEIADVSEGVQNILVRWDSLKPLLNPDIIE